MPLWAPLDLKCSTLFSLSLTIMWKGKCFLFYWVEHLSSELTHMSSVELPPRSRIKRRPGFIEFKKIVPWIGEQSYIEMLLRQFSNITIYIKLVKFRTSISMYRCSPIQGTRRWKSTEQICPLLSTRIRTFSPRFENNDRLKCWSGIFPKTLIYVVMMENCRNNNWMYGYSPIQRKRF